MDGAPPPPPPHGSNPKSTGGSGGLPPGNYDIFIIPPHSSGGGFLYLPSLQVQRNSFLAGVASTLASIAVWKTVEPTIKQWSVLISQSVATSGNGVILLIALFAVLWAVKTQYESGAFAGTGGPGNGPRGGAGGAGAGTSGSGYQRASPPPHGSYSGNGAPPPQGAHGGWGGQHQQRGGPQDDESWSGSQPDPDARANWEKAREETRRRDEEKKAKEEADRQARAKAEKEKWEKMRAREREQREREARERIARERAQKEKDAKDKVEKDRLAREAEARAKIEKEIRDKLEAEQKAKKAAEDKAAAEAAAIKAKADAERAERLKAARERAQRDREARIKSEAEKIRAQAGGESSAGRRSTTYGGSGGGERLDPYAGAKGPPAASVTSTQSSPIKATMSPKKNYEKPSAKSYIGTEDEHSFRPYDRPPKPPSHGSQYTASSYAASQSTARTTPPPSQRGPYSTNDPDKIQIKAVYLFNDLFPKPVAQLVSNVGKVTDGLILKIQTEGLFIDDDIRNMPQREWDVKAWTLKLIEIGQNASKRLHILRASVRDADGKKYVFFIDESESWKVAMGLQRLRKGSQVRSLQNNSMAQGEVTRILNAVPPLP